MRVFSRLLRGWQEPLNTNLPKGKPQFEAWNVFPIKSGGLVIGIFLTVFIAETLGPIRPGTCIERLNTYIETGTWPKKEKESVEKKKL